MRTARRLTIIEALRDPLLFGALPAFQELTTWRAWIVFLKAVYGLPLDAAEFATFQMHTHRSTYNPPRGGYPEVVCVVGRRAGKSRVCALIASFEAMTAENGTEDYALLVAQDQRAVQRTLFSRTTEPFKTVPMLQTSVEARTANTLTLSNGCVIAAYPCRPASVRGLGARVVLVDELAHFEASDGNPMDREMLRAVRPCLATTGGKLVTLSTPYAQTGALFELHRRFFGREDSPVLVWQATAPQMNPTLSAEYLEGQARDPEAYRAEVLGEFLAGISTFFDADAVAACVVEGVRERPAVAGTAYVGFVDQSSGREDGFAVGIAHREGDRVILDAVRAWTKRNPDECIAEASALFSAYGVRAAGGDGYAIGFVEAGFHKHGITFQRSARNRSAIYLDALPLVNAGRAVLLDVPELLRELRGLERTRGTAGRDKVNHRRGEHDDRANAALGALVNAAGVMAVTWTPEHGAAFGEANDAFHRSSPWTFDDNAIGGSGRIRNW